MLRVGGNSILYASPGPQTSVTWGSRIFDGGICTTSTFTSDLYPVTAVGDLAAEFTPPFHVVTVASQSASVPMQIGWLLGGLLLGLGVKRAVGR